MTVKTTIQYDKDPCHHHVAEVIVIQVEDEHQNVETGTSIIEVVCQVEVVYILVVVECFVDVV